MVQVLLSQVHRLRALKLLGSFLDMGDWAVDLALSVGIFPYVLKLLQTTALELRPTLVFIWTKILALDRSCQVISACTPLQQSVRSPPHEQYANSHKLATMIAALSVSLVTSLQWAWLTIAAESPAPCSVWSIQASCLLLVRLADAKHQ